MWMWMWLCTVGYVGMDVARLEALPNCVCVCAHAGHLHAMRVRCLSTLGRLSMEINSGPGPDSVCAGS